MINAASIGIAQGASCGLMEPRLAYYCRLSPHNIARENYVVARYVPLPLNRARRAISRGFVFVIDVKCRTVHGVKATPRESNLQLPLCHKSSAREPKRQLRDADVFFGRATCFCRIPGDTINFANHSDSVEMYVCACVCNRCRQTRYTYRRRWCF